MGGGDFCISLHRTGLKCSETYIKIVSVFGFCCRIFLHPKYFKIFLDFFSRSSGAFALFFEIFGCLTTFKVNRPANALLYFFFQVQRFFSRSNFFFLGLTFFFQVQRFFFLGLTFFYWALGSFLSYLFILLALRFYLKRQLFS